ncbi:MAG: chorismate-binding protein [Akkermansiaceae bacterium]
MPNGQNNLGSYPFALLTGAVQETELAFLKSGDGEYTVGFGPFEQASEPPEDKTAFYCNDFALSDPRPWKIPDRVEQVSCLADIGITAGDYEIEWSELETDGFAKVFAEINEMISRGVMEKSVPVATQRGVFQKGRGRDLLVSMAPLGAPFHTYGWRREGLGFCGATPEVLFQLDGKNMTTMALAGTAKADEREVFAVDGKEIREHEFVAQTLVAKLSDIGNVSRGQRSILDLGQLVHFHTPINVELFSERTVDELIKRLHPTPALGPLPRTEETMSLLAEWRERLGCPPCFGAPFGLLENGVFTSVVAIRGVHWGREQVSIPSGCGVIEASRLVNEWRELRLKREAVIDTLGI